MCGIAGIVEFDGATVEPSRLIGMTQRLVHRGPDGQGAVLVDRHGKACCDYQLDAGRLGAAVPQATVGLGHRRLSIIDLSQAGAQPMSDPDQTVWITFNGELYNYIELRAELESTGRRFATQSDTEVIIQAYLEWGHAALARFNGMFAFAIWDTRRQALFCARDHLGIKPLYYHAAGGRFVFASEQKAILAGLDRKPTPDVAAMADFLAFSYIPSDATMFSGIRRLGAGQWLVANADSVDVTSYWNPEFGRLDRRPESERVEELRSLLEDSMRMQVRSDVPLGAHLSGGIDSSTVTCLAARELPGLMTFTARFAEGAAFDETPYARQIVAHVGAQSKEIVPQRTDLLELLPKILYHLDEPVESASVFGKYHVAEIVSQSVKVVLGGQGGDELFGGYDWYIKSAFTALCFGAHSSSIDRSRARFMLEAIFKENRPRLLKSLIKSFGDRRLGHVFCRNWSRLPQQQISDVLRHDLYNGHPPAQERFLESFGSLDTERDVDAMFKFDMRHYLQSLLTSEDRLSMAFSVESRVPLLDYRIAEFAGRQGFEEKATPGLSKRLLRMAAQPIVPDAVLSRRDKRGFPTPIGRWLEDGSLRLIDRFVLHDNPFAREYLNLDGVRRMNRRRTLFSTDWAERMWRVLTLSVWGSVFELS